MSKASTYNLPVGASLDNHPDVFPLIAGQNWVNKTPQFKSRVAESVSGREVRGGWWSHPRWLFETDFELIRDQTTDSHLRRLFGFFGGHSGRQKEFLYLDPEDNTAVVEGFGVGDGTSTAFRLARSVGTGQHRFVEPVLAVSGVSAFVNGSQNLDFTMRDYGTIDFVNPPPAGSALTWSGRFFFVCRFEEDEMTFKQFMRRMWSQDGISWRSVKV